MSRLGISIAALFVMALLMYLPVWLAEPDETQRSKGLDALRPAYLAKNLTTTLYDENGKLNHQVFAKSMEHYDLLGFVLFEEPEYTVYVEENAPPWQVTANEGTLYNNNLIQLESDVIIKSLSQEDFVQTITTDFIKINLEAKTMASDQPVEIHGVEYVINSNGFKANLQTRKYELIDHVQTIYSPDR
ncbi:LPS export ABC transporter periplasmic protein LptC [Alteromonas pelagimontana]|uniref:Lipopolysaccharide export system protein LptC n=1 Tax=Alteromonas pelagimontana TaxID=1858656 RepID=A0A6M4MCH0_9ALTE|nr:LPS export ABC transporter periplasmic protein LptC [Alteromonas pelagimontana]QJR80245.1 LPS export ABC transporter periplasmic protein LptC [Alteromonas pelagimontana]